MEEKIIKTTKEMIALCKEQAKFFPWRTTPLRKEIEEKIKEIAKYLLSNESNNEIEDSLLEKVEVFRNNPIFVGGVIKSGTTLLRDLLDYHPEIVTLLNDSKISDVWRVKSQYSKNKFYKDLASIYIQRLFQPFDNRPEDLLDGVDNNLAEYKKFVSVLKHFVYKSENQADLISSLAASIFAVNGQFEKGHQPTIWAEKTPFSELYFEKMLEIYPQAKLVYVSRNPIDNFASIKKWFTRSKVNFNLFLELRGMRKSYKVVEKLKVKYPQKIHVIRYEDLINDSNKHLENLCSFLGVSYNKSLETPTRFNRISSPVSSHYDSKEKEKFKAGVIHKNFVNKGKSSLSDFEKYIIYKKLNNLSKFFNYEIEFDNNLSFSKKIIFELKLLKGQFSAWIILFKNKLRRFLKI